MLGLELGRVLTKGGRGGGAPIPTFGWEDINILSQPYDGSFWTNGNSTDSAITSALPAPAELGWRMQEDSATNQHNMRFGSGTFVTGVSWTMGVLAKAAERSVIWIYSVGGAKGIYFNLSTLAVSSSLGSGSTTISGTAVDVGGGWIDCNAIMPNPTAGISNEIIIGLAPSAGTLSYAGDGASGALFTGARLYQTALLP